MPQYVRLIDVTINGKPVAPLKGRSAQFAFRARGDNLAVLEAAREAGLDISAIINECLTRHVSDVAGGLATDRRKALDKFGERLRRK